MLSRVYHHLVRGVLHQTQMERFDSRRDTKWLDFREPISTRLQLLFRGDRIHVASSQYIDRVGCCSIRNLDEQKQKRCQNKTSRLDVRGRHNVVLNSILIKCTQKNKTDLNGPKANTS
jgi:hypothetical protein